MHKLTKLLRDSLLLGSLLMLFSAGQAKVRADANQPVTVQQINNTKAKPSRNVVKTNDQQAVQRPKVTNVHRANYDGRIANVHYRGYPIYGNGYFNASHPNVKPVGYQHQLRGQAVHVTRTAKVNHRLWVNFKSKINGWTDARALSKSTRWFYVPLISQRPQLPTGCEITATTMMLKHVVGNRVNKMKLAREMPRSSNPNRGFIGSPYRSSGWYIYPNGLRGIVNKYTHHHAWNMTGDSNQTIKKQINHGRPVVIWMANIDGFPNHALTVYGYNRNHLFMNDPWRDERRSLSLSYINAHRSMDAWRALSYK